MLDTNKELPKGWVETKIGKVAKIITGNTPSKNISEYYGGNICWVKPGDLHKEKIIFKTEETLSVEGAKKARLIPKKSVLVTCIGNLGNVAIAGDEMATNQQINSVVFEDNISSKYGYYWCTQLKKWLIENSTSTTISMVNKSVFETAPIIYPPLQEQNRIVAKLDQLFAHLETAKKGLEKIPTLLKEFRQAVLTQAVTGKLTEEWRVGKALDCASLIKDIYEHHESVGGHKKGNASNPDIEKHSLTFNDLPSDWGLIELRELCQNNKPISYGILMPGEEIKGGKPYLKVMSYPNNQIDMDKVRHTTIEIEESFKRARLETGDIVLSIRGTVGRVIIIPEKLNGANITQDSARISIQKIVNNYFISICLKSREVQNLMEKITKGVAVRGINIGDVRFIKLPIPSLEEQIEIVRRVEALFAKADVIEERYKSLKEKIDHLPQAILGKAFSGEL